MIAAALLQTKHPGTDQRVRAQLGAPARRWAACHNLRGNSWALASAATLFLAATIFSFPTRLPAQQPTAQALAQRVDRHYNQLHSLKASFTESYHGLGMSRTESGTMLLLKPGRMRWDYTSPAGKLFLLDGKFAWIYTKGDPEAQRIPARQLDDLRSPLRFLLGHTQLEKEIDKLSLAPAANGSFTLTGQLKGQEDRVSRLSLTVTANGVITAIEFEETDGAITSFTFTGEVANAPAPPSAFHFTPPAGVAIVDPQPTG